MSEKITTKKVYKSMAWKLLERIMSQGINLVVQIVLARILMPSDFGSLALIVAITNYAALFVHTGIGTVIIQKEDIDQIDIATLFTASLGVAFVIYVGLFFASPSIAAFYEIPVLKPALRVLALILFLNAFNSIQTAILSRKMKFKQLFLRSALAVPIAGGVGIAMALMGFGIWALVMHNLVNMLVVVIFMSFDKDTRVIRIGFNLDRAKKLYSFSLKILFTSIISGLHDTIRTMIIGKKYSSDDLAYYDKAYTYSYYAVSIVNSSMSTVLLPTFSRSQNDKKRLKEMARKSCGMAAFIMIPAMLGIASVSRPLVLLLLTSKWEPCIPFLALFCILRIPTFIMTIDKQVYYAIGKSEINLFYEIGLCIFNIIVLIISMQVGVFYIAIGATIVEYAGCVAICIIASKVYDYKLIERLKDIWKPIISSCVMVAVVLLVGNLQISNLYKLIIQILIGIITYGAFSMMLKDKHIGEIKHIILNR